MPNKAGLRQLKHFGPCESAGCTRPAKWLVGTVNLCGIHKRFPNAHAIASYGRSTPTNASVNRVSTHKRTRLGPPKREDTKFAVAENFYDAAPVKIVNAVNWCSCGEGIERRFRYCQPCLVALPAEERDAEHERLRFEARAKWSPSTRHARSGSW